MAGEHCDMESMGSMHSMHSMDAMQMGAMQMDAMPSMHDHAAEAPTSTPDDPSGKHTQLSNGDACGYCSLLAHLPVMPGVETLFVAAVRTRQHVVATRFESVRRVEPLTFAQPRAPPFIA
jgi:hypothetical protein